MELERASEGEAPRLLEREVEEAEVLELQRAAERADIDRPQADVGDELRHFLLRRVVVSGDEDVKLLASTSTSDKGSGKGGVERLHDRSRWAIRQQSRS
jgi:hypothetical protein